jgi:hypothetical protein
MANGTNEKGDERGERSADMRTGGRVDMATEKVMYWDVPFAGEFEPVNAVPPVRIEMTVCKTCAKFVSVKLKVKIDVEGMREGRRRGRAKGRYWGRVN